MEDVLTSKDNPRIKRIRKLMTSKKDRNAESSFVLEGLRLVTDALKNGASVTEIFVTQKTYEKHSDALLGYSGIMTFVSEELADRISDTDTTQGIFAVCSFPKPYGALPRLVRHGRYVVLSRLQDPGNMGMIIRTADALGLDGVILSQSCDVFSPKTIRATMGSLFRIPVYHSVSEDDVFPALSEAEIPSFAAVVDGGTDAVCADFSRGGAVFIGNEGNGLSKETADRCSERITIKMNGSIESLNAAMAAGIIMWELMK